MRKSRAFTLVELLVVIGIIALLISILMPALSAARRSAQTTKCLSNLRQIGTAYQIYAADFKGAIPVVRQDIPDDGGPQAGINPPIKFNIYWMNIIGPYVSKAKFGFEMATADKPEAYESIVWGCPEWQGRAGNPYATSTDTGYGMNSQFWQNADSVGATPKAERAMRWIQGATKTNPGTYPGKYWKIGSIRNAAEHVLVGDSLVWHLNAQLSNGSGESGLPGQPVNPNSVNASSTSKAGIMDYEFYRHSKKPSTSSDGVYWDKAGSKVACNALYADGHAETITGFAQAYKGIFLKNP